ncbi:helix-turn-helix domain-containing protein [Rathayibacter sp. AY1B8]|uniref:helix-turn-helix domain-containing protein n=1 Tax=Rathayibacter sp. AY1B8 TaxID=2080533 RepID=UPI000CE755A1|nr:helix-turn-helix domain-containing protein [Rathayibacter sp. AY1B8]PPI08215.1 hypothetical protein C5C63_04480 [Rathayibacter sp. AY1B8]
MEKLLASPTASTHLVGPVLRTPDAAAYCGIKPQTLYNLVHLGEGPRHYKQGRLLAFYPTDLDEWLTSRLTPAP